MATAPAPATLLLVEDEPSIRDLIARRLERKGYTVLTASNGLEALRVVEGHEGPVDLLVSDVVMPHMDGFTLESRLTVRFPALKALFMTGYADRTVAVRGGLEKSGRPYLLKPFLPDDLEAAILRELEAPARKRGASSPPPDDDHPQLEPHPRWRK